MKKILLVLALTLTGFLSQAQITFTSGTYSQWNMDTICANSTGATGAITIGKVISVPTNFGLVLQTKLILDTLSTGTLSSGGVFLQGSMDNVLWSNIPLGNTLANQGGALVGKSYQGLNIYDPYPASAAAAANQPLITATGALAGSTASTASDTLAVTAIATARHTALYTFTINNPIYTYYRIVYNLKPSATAMQLHIFTRYYLRKPY